MVHFAEVRQLLDMVVRANGVTQSRQTSTTASDGQNVRFSVIPSFLGDATNIFLNKYHLTAAVMKVGIETTSVVIDAI